MGSYEIICWVFNNISKTISLNNIKLGKTPKNVSKYTEMHENIPCKFEHPDFV